MTRYPRALLVLAVVAGLSFVGTGSATAQEPEPPLSELLVAVAIRDIEPVDAGEAQSPFGVSFTGVPGNTVLGVSSFYIEFPAGELTEPFQDDSTAAVTRDWPTDFEYFSASPYVSVWGIETSSHANPCGATSYQEVALFLTSPGRKVVPPLPDRPNDPGIGTSSVVSSICGNGAELGFFGLPGDDGHSPFANPYPLIFATYQDRFFTIFFIEDPSATGRVVASGAEDTSSQDTFYFFQAADIEGPARQIDLDSLSGNLELAEIRTDLAQGGDGQSGGSEQSAVAGADSDSGAGADQASTADQADQADSTAALSAEDEDEDEDEAGGDDLKPATEVRETDDPEEGEDDDGSPLLFVGIAGGLAALAAGAATIVAIRRRAGVSDVVLKSSRPRHRSRLAIDGLISEATAYGGLRIGSWQQLPDGIGDELFYIADDEEWIRRSRLGPETPLVGPPPPPEWLETRRGKRMEQFAYWVHDGGSIRVGSRRHPDGYTPEPNPTIIEHNEALMADAIDVVVPEARPDGDRSDTEENRP